MTLTETTPTKSAGGFLKRKLESLISLAVALTGRESGWYTPHSVTDAGGLYTHSRGGYRHAWLYHEFPMTLLRADETGVVGLDNLLRDLTRQCGSRPVHLALHSWEEKADTPVGTPAELAEYLAGSHTFFVPTRRLLIGVELRKSDSATAAEATTRGGLLSLVDRALGEYFPDLSAWDSDRALVESLFADRAGKPASVSGLSHLENWYTLGTAADVDVDERDDVIAFEDQTVLEFVAATALNPDAAGRPQTLMSAGRRGACVASVRGVTKTSGLASDRDEVTGSLSKVSVVLGRRSERSQTPWNITLRKFPGLEQRALPMRQLQALDETLPCSQVRVSPGLGRIRARELTAVGFVDNVVVGDDLGLFVGLASPDFAYPFYLNPSESSERPVTVVTGGAESGKTFTAEHLAVQAALAGRRVLYAHTGHGSGSAVSALVESATPLNLTGPGSLSPYRYLPGPMANQLASASLPLIVPGLTADELRDLDAGFRRADAVGTYGFEQALAYADGTTAVAKVKRAALRSAEAAHLLSGPQSPVRIGEVALVDLATLAGYDETAEAGAGSRLDLAVALLITYAHHSPSAAGTVVILDGAAGVLSGPLTSRAVADVSAARGPVQIITTTRHAEQVAASSLHRYIGRVIAHGEADRERAAAALHLVGLPDDPEHLNWLAGAAPHVDEGVVLRPALVIHRDRVGRRASALVGPVPERALAAFTRSRAQRYVSNS